MWGAESCKTIINMQRLHNNIYTCKLTKQQQRNAIKIQRNDKNANKAN